MARMRVILDASNEGLGAPILLHNERLADPLDQYARWLAELSKKRSKTERDIEEIGRREFFGGGYWIIDEGPDKKVSDPCVPTWNVIRCLQEAGTRHKLGKQVLRGIVPVVDETPLIYDGPRDAADLWKTGTFHSRKGVGIGQRRVMRTRPCFTNWRLEVDLEVDLTILDPDVVSLLVFEAGRFVGLADARPRFGRFLGSAEQVADPQEFAVPDLLDETRSALAAATARKSIEQADVENATRSPNGKERAKRVLAKMKD